MQCLAVYVALSLTYALMAATAGGDPATPEYELQFVANVTKSQRLMRQLAGALNSVFGSRPSEMVPIIFDAPGNAQNLLAGLRLPFAFFVTTSGEPWLGGRRADVPLPRADPVAVVLGRGNPRARLGRVLRALRSTPLWHSGALLVLVHSEPPSRAALAGAQRALARAGALRVLGIAPGRGGRARVVRYAPGRRPSRQPRLTTPSARALPSERPDVSGHTVVFTVHTNSLQEKSLCLGGCVDCWKDPALQGVRTVADHYGMRALCYSEPWQLEGERLPNGSYLGLTASVVSGSADIMFYETFTYLEWQQECGLPYPHGVEGFCIYVRKSSPVPFHESLMGSFHEDAWAGTGVSLLALTAVRLLAGERGLLAAALETLRCFINGSFRRRARTLLLGVSIATSVFGVIMLNAFQSSFTSYLSTPAYKPEIDTLKAVDSKMNTIYTYPGWKGRFLADKSPIMKRLGEKVQGLHRGWYRSLAEIIEYGDRGLLVNARHAFYLVNRRAFTKDRYSRLHQVKECFLSSAPKNFVTRKHSPYLNHMDTLLQRSVQGGIIDQWWEGNKAEVERRYDLVHTLKGSQVLQPYPLEAHHFLGAFVIWGWGLLFSLIMFIAEICSSKCALGPNKSKK